MATLDSMINEDDSSTILAPQHVMIYGPPKVGKTQLIGELAKQGFKLIWFDGENGKTTLLKLPREALANITYIGMKDTPDNSIFHATMDKIVKGGDYNICDTHGLVDCPNCKRDGAAISLVSIPTAFNADTSKTIVVADSSTQLSLSIMNTVMKPIWARDITAKIEWDHYAKQGAYLNRIFGFVQQAPYHFITTAHEIEAEREDGGARIVPSIGTRNYAINCGKFFDHIVYMDKVNGRHMAASSTGYKNNVLTGSRTDVDMQKMEVPTLADIFLGKVGTAQTSQASQTSASLASTAKTASALGSTSGIGVKVGIGGIKVGG